MGKRLRTPYRLYLRGETYWAYFTLQTETGDNPRFRCSTGTSDIRRAEQFCIQKITELQQKAKQQANGELPSITIDDAFTRYYEEKVQYYSQPKAILSRLFFIRDNIGVKYLHELDKQALSKFVEFRKKTVSNATINRELSALSAIRTLAKDFWEYKTNEAKPLQFKQLEPAENIKFLEDWEVAQAIIDKAPAHLKPIIYTALYTGMRKSNILGLKWSDINFKANTIIIQVKDKNTLGGKNHTIPMVDKLKDILLEQPRINEYVFNYQDKPIDNIKRSWTNIFYEFVPTDKAKPDDVIETRYIKNKKTGEMEKVIYKRVLRDPSLPYVNFHTLRHTAATWILRKTNNLRITKEILGHANINTTMKYAHVLDDEKRNALNSVFS
jgi:integrase